MITSRAAYSLHSRATRRPSLPVNALPGVVTDVIAVATPDLSMSSSDLETLQAITGGCRSLLNSETYFGGAMW